MPPVAVQVEPLETKNSIAPVVQVQAVGVEPFDLDDDSSNQYAVEKNPGKKAKGYFFLFWYLLKF